jgi:hypothetical protein
MADIEFTKPNLTTDKPTVEEEQAFRTAVAGRIESLPDHRDTTADETPPYDLRHVTVGDGEGAKAGGNVDMQGDEIAGFSYDTLSITASTTINVANWKSYRGRWVYANSASAITITISDTAATGTAQSGTSTTMVIDAGDGAADGAYDWQIVAITSGTGSGQTAVIKSYTSATKTIVPETAFATAPASDSVYEIRPRGDLAMMVKRRGTGAVTIAAAGDLVVEAPVASISVRYGCAMVLADLGLDIITVAAA